MTINNSHKVIHIKEQSVFCFCLYGRCLVWPDTHLEVRLSPSDSRDTIPLSREHPKRGAATASVYHSKVPVITAHRNYGILSRRLLFPQTSTLINSV